MRSKDEIAEAFKVMNDPMCAGCPMTDFCMEYPENKMLICKASNELVRWILT